ncbi:MAG: electron transfer flavoprotein subunit alpha/FixB family protein [Candidatus Hodgkinia cicadicola]|nr:MAG: electron transfer flavoprotein subunit alpha/FixB family protein [Candidatus Hodgkinia cicadicola]
MSKIGLLAKVLAFVDLHEASTVRLAVDSLKLMGYAHSISAKVDTLILNCSPTSARAMQIGSSKMYILSSTKLVNKRVSAPSLANLMCALSFGYDAVLVSGSSYWHDVLCRASAILNKPVVSNVCGQASPNLGEFVRSVYSGRLMQHIKCTHSKPWLLSIRTSGFGAYSVGNAEANALIPSIQLVQHSVAHCCVTLKYELFKRTELPPLSEADIVIAGGKPFGSAEAFNKYLRPLAASLSAAIGATRAAVDAGYAPFEYQIGQTGKVITPKLYIAFGISGSDHHMVGVRNAKIIVAVNTDASAPIVKLADYTVASDMFDLIPKALTFLKALRAQQAASA